MRLLTRWMTLLFLCIIFCSTRAQAGYTLYGYSGLVLTPSALPEQDGTLAIGINRVPRLYNTALRPASRTVFSSSLYFLPRLEVMLGITRPDDYQGGLGDRTGAFRLFVLGEKKYTPALAIGAQDFFAAHQLDFEPVSAQHFSSAYAVLSKSFVQHKLVLSLGYGQKVFPANEHHLVGAFGGLQWQPYEWVSMVAEYDAENWNAGVHFTIFQHLGFQFDWWKMQHLMWRMHYTFHLLD